ncbi:DNA (cytosine-5-)-methyltransferase [Dechloromonas agitata]|uniref:DNA (cytosine-5-)-methyltransferase n=1 Tax=Dechloromonas agitata TaxID=73030 RepID=UPI0004B303F0|nr:DNA (cytosine-5-)-methyltransferase [Dechloromonas agitata]
MEDKKNAAQPLRVLELFAGVGGFRLGLNAVSEEQGQSAFEVVWSNQWEPATRTQWAAQVYQARWGSNDLVNRDIFEVLADPDAMARIDSANPDMLVGGFPCQDYSVAQPANRAQGLVGKKGVLWWAIHALLEHRRDVGQPIKYLMLENVDRLLASPSICRGRDFAVILASLQALGYAVEWRIINAADYGYPQKRRRAFILAYHQSTPAYAAIHAALACHQPLDWLTMTGVMTSALPCQLKSGATLRQFTLAGDVWTTQNNYTPLNGKSQFQSGGLMLAGNVWTGDLAAPVIEDFTSFVGMPTPRTLWDVVAGTKVVPEDFFLPEFSLERWSYLKGAKSIPRNRNGHAYCYTEGAMAFPDTLDAPARTIITSEGGSSPSRTTHVVRHEDERLRRLLPEELEALNGFPRGFTDISGISARQRAFLMGNALVTGLVTRLGKALQYFTNDPSFKMSTPGAECDLAGSGVTPQDSQTDTATADVSMNIAEFVARCPSLAWLLGETAASDRQRTGYCCPAYVIDSGHLTEMGFGPISRYSLIVCPPPELTPGPIHLERTIQIELVPQLDESQADTVAFYEAATPENGQVRIGIPIYIVEALVRSGREAGVADGDIRIPVVFVCGEKTHCVTTNIPDDWDCSMERFEKWRHEYSWGQYCMSDDELQLLDASLVGVSDFTPWEHEVYETANAREVVAVVMSGCDLGANPFSPGEDVAIHDDTRVLPT